MLQSESAIGITAVSNRLRCIVYPPELSGVCKKSNITKIKFTESGYSFVNQLGLTAVQIIYSLFLRLENHAKLKLYEMSILFSSFHEAPGTSNGMRSRKEHT